MPTAAPIRFRCPSCGKALGVSRSKAGAVVTCPGCSNDLIVPEPPAPAPATPPNPSPSSSRVEPAVVPWDRSPPPEEGEATETVEFAGVKIEAPSIRPEPPRGRIARPRPAPREPDPTLPSPEVMAAMLEVNTASSPAPPPPVADSPAVSVSDPPWPAGGRARGLRRDDVAIPRSVMVLWSLLVLMAVASAFAAGLLAGRFVWAPGLARPIGGAAAPR